MMTITLRRRFFANHNKKSRGQKVITWPINPDENNNIGLVYSGFDWVEPISVAKSHYTISFIYSVSVSDEKHTVIRYSN